MNFFRTFTEQMTCRGHILRRHLLEKMYRGHEANVRFAASLLHWFSDSTNTNHHYCQFCLTSQFYHSYIQGCSGKFGFGGALVKYLGGRRWRDRRSRARREAPERRGWWGLGRGTVAPLQHGGQGLCPQKNFQKINLEITYFRPS